MGNVLAIVGCFRRVADTCGIMPRLRMCPWDEVQIPQGTIRCQGLVAPLDKSLGPGLNPQASIRCQKFREHIGDECQRGKPHFSATAEKPPAGGVILVFRGCWVEAGKHNLSTPDGRRSDWGISLSPKASVLGNPFLRLITAAWVVLR